MGNLTTLQKIAIVMAVLGVLSTSGIQLADIIGAGFAKVVVSLSSLTNSLLASIVAVLTGQQNIVKRVDQDVLVKEVAAMPGVQSVEVNANANATLATLAVDPNVDKVVPAKGAATAVLETASKG